MFFSEAENLVLEATVEVHRDADSAWIRKFLVSPSFLGVTRHRQLKIFCCRCEGGESSPKKFLGSYKKKLVEGQFLALRHIEWLWFSLL